MKLSFKKQGDCLYGTSHWYGTLNGKPALVTTWYSGAAIWIFTTEWKQFKRFRDHAELRKFIDERSVS